jgi:2-hydroxychromene-2-carboxylate isomerase
MTHGRQPPPAAVDFHFDVMCPWAYQASLWIREVRDHAGVDVRWRFFSLEEINHVEGKKHPWERPWSYGWSLMRIGALLRRTDMALLDQWYDVAGTALHVHGRRPHRREVAEELLSELGVDRTLVQQALDDETTSDEVRAEHQEVVDLGFFGVPTLRFDNGQALFGPVLLDPPTGNEAVRLWEDVCTWLDHPNVFEIKRPKRPADLQRTEEVFRPYVEARDWNTIQRPAP